MADCNEVTLIIHGTFAVGEDKDLWWRRGSDTGASDATFADRLEQELAARDTPGTVWCGLEDASQYKQF